MATVEDKEIPGGLLSFFRSYEHVYSIIFVFCFTSRVICGLFFIFGSSGVFGQNIIGVWFGFAEEKGEKEEQEREGIPISTLASLLSKSNSRHRFRRGVAGTATVGSFTSK